jgi:hypothetical protein
MMLGPALLVALLALQAPPLAFAQAQTRRAAPAAAKPAAAKPTAAAGQPQQQQQRGAPATPSAPSGSGTRTATATATATTSGRGSSGPSTTASKVSGNANATPVSSSATPDRGAKPSGGRPSSTAAQGASTTCVEVTGATIIGGSDHTCSQWAKGRYYRQTGLESGKPVWHREDLHVNNLGIQGGEDIRLVFASESGDGDVGWTIDRADHKGGGGYLCEQAHPERIDSPLDCKMFVLDFAATDPAIHGRKESHR